MSEREHYPPGVPCWVDTLQADPQAALDFYGPLFGWEFAGPGPMPGQAPGKYFVAQLRGRDVAGIGSAPAADRPPPVAWNTYVRVDSVEHAAERAGAAGGRLLDEPADALPAGRLAVVADPAGAVLGLWEAGTREGAQLVNEPRTWALSILHTTDLAGSKAFYRTLFGWQAEAFGPAGGQMVLCRLPGYVGGEPTQPVPRDVIGVILAIGGGESGPTERPHWSVDFWMEDADAVAAQTTELGGKVIVPPHDTPGFRSAVLADPEGAVFSVSQLIRGR
jgi:predicted enzyme related to lactoylglutathione lyase